ncbi:MAG: GSU2403 family nucleotidyltransferase fold protein [Rubrivivax sp.]
MNYLPLPENAARQMIDSVTVFNEHRRVQAEARKHAGGMYWKRQGEYEYLVKTTPDNRQQRLGPRTEETQRTYQAFTQRKQEAESRLKSLRAALKEAERLNKAVKAGRVPGIVVALLQTLDDAGLGQHFAVVGTHALYAYEAAAGVRIAQGALATQDVDLLWDARRRVQFVTDLERGDRSMLGVLQRVDPTFRRKELHHETAINDRGFEVDFLRRMPIDGDPHPFRFSDDEDDLWPVQAARASVLTDAPRFEHVVVSVTGKMALMRTIAPATFIEFKRWMAESAPHRPPLKRRRDRLQADIVQALLDEGLLLSEP